MPQTEISAARGWVDGADGEAFITSIAQANVSAGGQP